MKKLTIGEKLELYFTPQHNQWGEQVMKDRCGRALLPLDQVCFPWPADEGPYLVMSGVVLGSQWEYGGQLQALVPIKVDRHFGATFGIMPILTLRPELLTKTPNDLWLCNVFMQRVAEGNALAIISRGGVLHINSIPIVATIGENHAR